MTALYWLCDEHFVLITWWRLCTKYVARKYLLRIIFGGFYAHLVFTRMPVESYCRKFWCLLCSCDVLWALIFIGWFYVAVLSKWNANNCLLWEEGALGVLCMAIHHRISWNPLNITFKHFSRPNMARDRLIVYFILLHSCFKLSMVP